jgi:1-acyl-sn-glycerol-3-phosphate acyltransferase
VKNKPTRLKAPHWTVNFDMVDFVGLLGARSVFVVVFIVFVLSAVGASVVAVRQEAKIWKAKSLPSLSWIGSIKVFLLNIVWITFCFMGSVLIVVLSILTLGMIDKTALAAAVEKFTAHCIVHWFVGRATVVGTEHMPKEHCIPAPIYIANHASQIDVAVVYHIERQFLWVAKRSVLYVPGVGSLMWLAGHILVDRNNKTGASNFYPKARAALQSGRPMFIFPQGTRRIAERLPPKRGAFAVAMENKSMLVPISVEIPMDAWNSWHPITCLWGKESPIITITIHKPIAVNGTEDRSQLEDQCMDQIYSVLPKIYDAKTK